MCASITALLCFAFFPLYLSVYFVPPLLQEQDEQGSEVVSVVCGVLYFSGFLDFRGFYCPSSFFSLRVLHGLLFHGDV